MPFVDRVDAGRRLVEQLRHLRGEDVVVLGLPRGGVPVAFEVARALGAALDVIVVRKLGVPFQPELGMGAIGEGDVLIMNEHVVRMAGVTQAEIAEVEKRERAELERRARRFRGDRPQLTLAGRTAVVIDDGIATGSTARAACQAARAQGAARIVLAVPVCSPDTTRSLRDEVDEMVCLKTPRRFYAVGQWYADFRQTSDAEVVDLLRRSEQAPPVVAAAGAIVAAAGAINDDPPLRDEEVEVSGGPLRLAGHLTVPEQPRGVVVFAHGSGSSRHSPRNRYVAAALHQSGLATLLFDLLTPEEETNRANVFDIELLAGRLTEVSAWVRTQPECENLPIGYFGASTGAATALWAAAAPHADIAAVVSRGGQPDLAGPRLAEVRAPTLLIVGGYDDIVLELNRRAQALMRCANRLAVVPGATHLFEEPGTLERAAALAGDWFVGHLIPVTQSSA